MRILLCVLLSTTLLPGVDAWGDEQAMATTPAKVKKPTRCSFPKSSKRAPDWVCNAHAQGLAVAAVGTATKSGAGISFMEQMAAADARARLVREVRESVSIKVRGSATAASKPADESDGALITTITNDSLPNTKIEKSVYGPKGTLYVLVGLDEASANQLIETVTAEYVKRKRQ